MIVEWKTKNDEFAHKKGKTNKNKTGNVFVIRKGTDKDRVST